MQPFVQFVSYDSPNDVGGVSSWLRRIVPTLREQGIDARVDLFCFGNKPGANAEWYRSQNVPLRWSPWQYDSRRAVRQCLQWLREDLPQVYVPNCIVPAYFAAAEAKRCGARTIGVLHSDDPFYWGIVDEFVHGSEAWRLDELVTVSRFLRDAVRSNGHVSMPVYEIPYGVTIPQWRATWPKEKLRIIYTGRLVEEQKRISDLAQAFCRAIRENNNLEAWIVGAGPAEADVRNIIRAEGMSERVILKGRVDPGQIHEVLGECQIFALLSDYEGIPISLMEAMAVGLVPICLETRSGVDEVISHMKNGILVRDREKSFSDAVSCLIKNPELWSKLSAAARRTILERYSEERGVAHWKEILISDGSIIPSARGLRMSLALPPRNPKFGHYDQRPNTVQRAWKRLRRAAGFTRRAALKMVQSMPTGQES
jgi:glycosyltransferase involved in cell wall biosynthesis